VCLALLREAGPFVASQDSALLLRALKCTDSVSIVGISVQSYVEIISLVTTIIVLHYTQASIALC